MPKIYESPDKGQTVYAREFGGKQRQLHVQSPRAISIIDQLAEDKLWGDIRRKAKTQPALQDALDRVIIIYELGKTNE
jgi:hypothetical protein